MKESCLTDLRKPRIGAPTSQLAEFLRLAPTPAGGWKLGAARQDHLESQISDSSFAIAQRFRCELEWRPTEVLCKVWHPRNSPLPQPQVSKPFLVPACEECAC